MSKRLLLLFGLLTLPLTASGAIGRFADAEPIWEVDDMKPIPEPEVRGFNRYQAFIENYWRIPLDHALALKRHKPAQDINAIEEVPASSWFTPRNTQVMLPAREVERGSVDAAELAGSGPLQVLRARIDGTEPFFEILEPSGRLCILTFDHPGFPEMRTAAEVISNRLLHAAGYNVLAAFIAEIDPGRFELAPDAGKLGEFGSEGELHQEELDRFLTRIYHAPGGVRAVVSRLPAGTPKGGFPERGRRSDDPNDRIAHEERRSLRGLAVMAAWLDHTRINAARTLDVYLQPDGYLKHYLTDLGMTLGARCQSPHPSGTEGTEAYCDLGAWTRNFALLGFGRDYERPARPITFPGVGDFTSLGFNPLAWKAAYAYAPFVEMDWADALWGAKLVASFTDVQICAAVTAGKLSDHGAEAYMVDMLRERRDRIARGWFMATNAADYFEIQQPLQGRWVLAFEDLAVSNGVAEPEDVRYLATLLIPEFGERLMQASMGGAHLTFDLTRFAPRASLHRNDPRRYICVEFEAYDYRDWQRYGLTRVHVYFDSADGPRVVGIERE